jgi:DNA-binding PadR family transcriptional regulator
MQAARELTELEGCVLGLVWAKGPCTPYLVRKEFLESASPHWSGSAGAIYPLVERLERRRFIRAEAHATGRRRSKRYVLTPAGIRSLCGWLSPPLSDETVGVPPDPLRTRLRFLAALPRAQQVAFLSDAETKLQSQLRRVEADSLRRVMEGRYYYWMNLGAIGALQARLEWIRQIALELQDCHSAGGPADDRPARTSTRTVKKRLEAGRPLPASGVGKDGSGTENE